MCGGSAVCLPQTPGTTGTCCGLRSDFQHQQVSLDYLLNTRCKSGVVLSAFVKSLSGSLPSLKQEQDQRGQVNDQGHTANRHVS